MAREPRPHHAARRVGPSTRDQHDTVSIKVGPVPVKKRVMRRLNKELVIGKLPESGMQIKVHNIVGTSSPPPKIILD